MKVTPLNDWVLVKLFPLPEVSPGGIIIPMGAPSSDIRFAEVLATGPGKDTSDGLREPTGLSVGDIVAFDRWHTQHKSGQATSIVLSEGGEERALVKPEDVLYVVDDPPKDLYDVVWGCGKCF